jgi:hypothetical protein
MTATAEQIFIDEQVAKLVKRLKGATLIGIPIDMNNPRLVLVAAYEAGREDGERRLDMSDWLYEGDTHDRNR